MNKKNIAAIIFACTILTANGANAKEINDWAFNSFTELNAGGILSEKDMDSLIGLGLEISGGSEEEMGLEQSIVYSAFSRRTKISERKSNTDIISKAD